MNIAIPGDTSRRRIAAVGMWDGVHCGHRFLIDFVRREAVARGLVPSVVTFRNHPLTIVRPEAAPPLLTDCDTRLSLLGDAGVADCVLLDFDEHLRNMTALEFLTMLRERYAVDTLVMGFNNRFGHDRNLSRDAYAELGRSIGMEVIPAPEFRNGSQHVSSSEIRALVADGNVDTARKLLGRPFAIKGRVVHGRRLGRQIGFPTANIALPDSSLLIPGIGVYAVEVIMPDGVRRQAVVNIGRRPTVDVAGAPLTIEAHIFDFDGNLYSQMLVVGFAGLLRREHTFENLEALKRQLAADASHARQLLATV